MKKIYENPIIEIICYLNENTLSDSTIFDNNGILDEEDNIHDWF